MGAEILKNLVLPGVGTFTIVDNQDVEEEDLGLNFFLNEVCLGRPRAECLTTFLLELNPDVKGYWRQADNVDDLDLRQFTLVILIVPGENHNTTAAIKLQCKQFHVPLVKVNSQGFYSYFHITLSESLPIVETHPESTATTDLRLFSPWLELTAFARELTTDMDNLSDHKHGHIPYIALLLHYLDEWKASHDGEVPKSYTDKTAFRKLVANGARTGTSEGREENYDEAVAAVLKTITLFTLTSSVRELFDTATTTEASNTSSFWFVTRAVKQFYDTHGALPLPGSVPDMKAESETYVRLQNIYKSKARKDVEEVWNFIQKDAAVHGGSNTDPGSFCTKEEVENYCKNAAFVKLIPPSVDDTNQGAELRQLSDRELNDEFALQPTLIPIFLALRATEYPGQNTPSKSPEKWELDIDSILHSMATAICTNQDEIESKAIDFKADGRLHNVAKEVARSRGGELHNISALTGGMVAQEVIKLITKQYVPVDNVCVFDGIYSRTQVFRL